MALPTITNPTPTTKPAQPAQPARTFDLLYQTIQQVDSRLMNGPWPTTITVQGQSSATGQLDGIDRRYRIADLRTLIAQFPVLAVSAAATLAGTTGMIHLLAARDAVAIAAALPNDDGTKAGKLAAATSAETAAGDSMGLDAAIALAQQTLAGLQAAKQAAAELAV